MGALFGAISYWIRARATLLHRVMLILLKLQAPIILSRQDHFTPSVCGDMLTVRAGSATWNSYLSAQRTLL